MSLRAETEVVSSLGDRSGHGRSPEQVVDQGALDPDQCELSINDIDKAAQATCMRLLIGMLCPPFHFGSTAMRVQCCAPYLVAFWPKNDSI